MSDKDETKSFGKNITFLITSYFFLKEIIKLVLLEFKLARSSLKAMLISSIALIFLMFSFWCLLLFICIFVLHDYLGDWLLAFVITAAINMFFIGIAFLFVTKYPKNLNFSHTRKYLFNRE